MAKKDSLYKGVLLEKELFNYATKYQEKRGRSLTEQQVDFKKLKYVLYARRSTEDKKRQVQSLPAQVRECKRFAKREKLTITEIIREKKSAMTSGKRDKFNKMIEELKKGKKYNAILCWHPDRLARNMKESGEILDLMDKNVIVDLKCPSYHFVNDAGGKMTLSILFAMAKEFSDKLSVDTIRGLDTGAKEGKSVGVRKLGYIHNKEKYFRPNKNNFNELKHAWILKSEDKNHVEIQKYLKDYDVLVSEKKLSYIFKDPFYAGLFCFGDNIVDLRELDKGFVPMVEPEVFMKIQNTKQVRGYGKETGYRPLRKLIRCGNCNRFMTPALKKTKALVYVACSNKDCINERKKKGLRPSDNAVRGDLILKHYLKYIEAANNFTEEMYNNLKDTYLLTRSDELKDVSEEIKITKSSITKTSNKLTDAKNALYREKSLALSDSIANDSRLLIDDLNDLEDELKRLQKKRIKIENDLKTNFPDFSEFLNFFENVATAIQTTQDPFLMDQLIRLVFQNLVVLDKKVVGQTFTEVFESFEKLKISNGVEDGA